MQDSTITPADEAINIWDSYHYAVAMYGEDSRQAKQLRALFFLACQVVKNG